VTIVAPGRVCRCSTKAAISRIGPSLGAGPVLALHDPGHRDQHVDLGVLGDHPGADLGDARGVGGVDAVGVQAGVRGGDLVEQGGAASADDHDVALGLEGEREGQADAAGRAGDEDGVSGDSHGSSVRRARQADQRAVVGGSPIPGCARDLAPILLGWIVTRWPTSCSGTGRRCALPTWA
jgi:hypothetical protein